MSFYRHALGVILGALVVVFAVTTYLTSALFVSNAEKTEIGQYELMRKIIEFNLQGLENRALARAELVASLPRVQDLFAAGDRDGLAAELKTMFEVQRDKYGVDQAQFHVRPATSFLRLNNPSRFGDDLSSYRPIVVAVNEDTVARKGLSISRSGPGVFGVSPVFDRAGKYIGSFEIGGDFGPVLDGVKRAYGLDSVLFIDEARLKAAAPDLGGDVYSEKNRVGRFIKYKSTNWDLLKGLVSDAELSSPSIESEPYVREAQDTPYGVVAIPLRNPAGDTLGIIVVAKDFSGTRAILGQSMVWTVMYALFGLVLLAGVVLVVLRGAVGKPLAILSGRLRAMANGETPAEPLADTAGYYKEIKELADSCEALRADRPAVAP